MGMFDTVYALCPSCGASIGFQSKAGPCYLAEYSVNDAPEEVITDLDGETPYCEVCHTRLRLTKQSRVVSHLVVAVDA